MRNVGLWCLSAEDPAHAYVVFYLQEVFLMKWLDQSTSKSYLQWSQSCSNIYELQSVTSVCLSIHRTVADVFDDDDDDDDNWTQPYVATMWPN